MRTKAREAWRAWKAGKPLAAQPDQATLRRMMDTIAGMPIPEHYVPFLLEELAMDTRTPSAPDRPQAESQRPQAESADHRCRDVGPSVGAAAETGGIDFEIVEKNEGCQRHLAGQSLSGCRVDNPSHMYSYSFEDNHVGLSLSDQPVLLEYFRGVAKRHDLRPHVRFRTTVDEARLTRPPMSGASPCAWNGGCRDAGRRCGHQRGRSLTAAPPDRDRGLQDVQGPASIGPAGTTASI